MMGLVLFERAAAKELAQARAIFADGGVSALVASAEEHVAAAAAHRASARGSGDARYERGARAAAEAELGAEAALIVLCESVANETLDPRRVLRLAATPGRWTRRVRAFAVLTQLSDRHPAVRIVVGPGVLPFVSPREHRWVQVAAMEALIAADRAEAQRRLFARLASPGSCDDALVRARFVEIARAADLIDVAVTALGDPSELVRQAACDACDHAGALARAARTDRSARVRAVAVRALGRVTGAAGAPSLLERIEHDPASLVVRRALAALDEIAIETGRVPDDTFAILARAATRTELEPATLRQVEQTAARIEIMVDPELRRLHALVSAAAKSAPVGGGARIAAADAADDEKLGRVLAAVADRDFALSVERSRDRIVIRRGEPRRLRGWRLLHELRHPSPSKRQGFAHAAGWSPRGALRAAPAGLAELTPTRAPAERVLSRTRGDWGVALPRPFDVLGTGGREVKIVSATGTTVLAPPRGLGDRVAGWVKVTFGMSRLAEARKRSLDTDEPTVARAYVNELERASGVTIRFEPHAFGATGARFVVPRELSASLALLAPIAVHTQESGFLGMLASPEGNRLSHVALCAGGLFAFALARSMTVDARVRRDRASIPLVIGGWGTRGKSGTERLKGALIQGMGFESLVKTTGCEAMFIHAIPDVPAREIFLYRPYDKATIWEQREVVSLAARLRVRALLWECMALQPDLVELLQHQWMRDDFTTITNAYPDHEDVQGPSGHDVAEVISSFVPRNGTLLTAEAQMLPVLAARAHERKTRLASVDEDAGELIASDLVDRFPYHEHPQNLALVARLGEALGVPPVVALAEMADHVVPDLGVLRTYPRVAHAGRTLEFSNGMSANERMGALSNWQRLGFDRHDPDADPRRFIVTVVNNRDDRLARSEVFARLVVEDLSAHRHVLIGTNVDGLRRMIALALDEHLAKIDPSRDLEGAPAERVTTALRRVRSALAWLKIGRLDPATTGASLRALGLSVPATLAELLAPASADETYAEAKSRVSMALAPFAMSDEERPFVVKLIAERRAARALCDLVVTVTVEPERLSSAFRDLCGSVFRESVVALRDPNLSGDQIIDQVARIAPPGARVSMMGMQNIKGTGLDFVYRWVGLDAIERAAARAEAAPSPEERETVLRALVARGDMGAIEARHALRRVAAFASPAIVAELERIAIAKERALGARRRASGAVLRARVFFGKMFDFADSVLRRRAATGVMDALVAGSISHATAAERMRLLNARQYGEWARATRA